MTRIVLSIYDYLSRHKVPTILLLGVGLALCVVLSLRLDYKENAADFLPRGDNRYTSVYESMGDQGRITLLFRSTTSDGDETVLMDAVDAFEEQWMQRCEYEEVKLQCRADESQVFEAMDYLRRHVALFLTPADYQRMDSLLAQPDYIDTCLSHVRRMMAYPMSGVAVDAVASDPLNLFSPVLQRLSNLSVSDHYEMRDGYIFDQDGVAYAFLTSPYASSDTRGNATVADAIAAVADSVMNAMPEVRVSAVGAPLIAVTNARQIKRDSFISILLALVLIMAILFTSMGHRRNILYLGLSVVAGWLFALAVIALVRPAISIIVVGIGSVLVGIAVNYPLHYLDYVRDHPDSRASLKVMVAPLLTGNVTTVSAFACLIFVKAEAMRDLGLFGALMLVGTILFVMVFLPLMAQPGWGKGRSGVRMFKCSDSDNLEVSKSGSVLRPWVFLLLLVVTIYLGYRGSHTQFDDNLSHINYMTAQQREDLKILSQSIDDDSSHTQIYGVAEGATLDEALFHGERALKGLEKLSEGEQDAVSVGGIGTLLPSSSRQREALDQWDVFLSRHAGLADEVRRCALREGFAANAFDPFVQLLGQPREEVSPEAMAAVTSLASDFLLKTDSSVRVVYWVRSPHDEAERVKETWRGGQDSHVYAFDASDVGSHLVSDLSEDFNYILYVCGVVVFFFLWLSLGRLELALLAFLPLTVGWLWILGLMDLVSIQFNIVNIILATFIFGQGDDYTIFITEGLMDEYATGQPRLKGFRRSVVLSAVLMFVGLGVLVVARHPAMRSLGEVALLGMSIVIGMACVLPPWLFKMLTRKGDKKRMAPVTLRRLACTGVALVVALVAMLVVTPLTWLWQLVGGRSERMRYAFHCLIHRCCVWAQALMPDVRHRLVNEAGEDFSTPCVVVANHQSHLDLVCMLALTPKLVVLTNDWVWRNPMYGAIIRYAEYLPASRGYEALLPQLRDLVARGYSVLVFPEGTRSRDGSIGRFHQGAFLLARELKLDVLPVLLHGAGDVMPKEELLMRRGSITTIVQPRIPYARITEGDLREVAQWMRHSYERRYAEVRRKWEDEDYFLPFVYYQYIYKGRSVERRCRKALRQWKRSGEMGPVGQGETALLTALAHPEQQYDVTFDNMDDFLVASHCAVVPANLHYRLSAVLNSEQEEGGCR